MADNTINDILLKNLTFQTLQTNWDGGSINFSRNNIQSICLIFLPRLWFSQTMFVCRSVKIQFAQFEIETHQIRYLGHVSTI